MEDQIKKIKDKLDIVDVIKEYIPLQQAGKNFKALCPFHKEKTPSFIISPERQTWHCFGQCNEGGDVISFIMKYENVDFYSALKNLAKKAGVVLKNISSTQRAETGVLENIHRSAKDFFITQLNKELSANEYLKSRGIKKETITDFELGYAPNEKDSLLIYLTNIGYDISNIEKSGLIFKTKFGTYMDRFRGRIIFPIHNTFGDVIAFSGRILPDFDDGKVAKYINSPETPIYHKFRVLYGYYLSKKYIQEKNSVVIVEGNVDVIMLWQDGVKNVVAVSGTALTEDHLKTLSRSAEKIIFSFDNDKAGIVATERAIDMANKLDIFSEVFILKDDKDVADFILKNSGKIKNLIASHKKSSLDFYLDLYLGSFNEKNEFGKKMDMKKILNKIEFIKSPIEKYKWIKKISEVTKIPDSLLLEELGGIKKYKEESETGKEYKEKNASENYTNRIEKIAFRILKLYFINKELKREITDFLVYFPESLLNLANAVIFEEKDTEFEEKVALIEMQSTFEEIDKEMVGKEIKFLLRELKKESLKNKRSKLQVEILELEKKGDIEKLKKILKEFDEITKLLNT